jgi:hypothetical protein
MTMRQVDRAADHLVGFARVNTEPNGHLDGRVLFGRRRLLGQLGRLQRRVEVGAVRLLGGGAICLAVLAHSTIQSDGGLWLMSGPKLALPLFFNCRTKTIRP